MSEFERQLDPGGNTRNGHDAEFGERQLIDCVLYYPKPDIENTEIP